MAIRLVAIASRVEAIAIIGWRPLLLGWRPSLLGWRHVEAIATRLEAIRTSHLCQRLSPGGICLEGSVAGRVWDLSQRSKGCRYVQAALENCGDGERFTLALELQGHVLAAARSACANYVLQKIIQVLRPQACQFIIDEIMKTPADVPILARHQYGCRILQRLLEHCQAQQMEGLVKLLLEDATALVRHNYGTFVMQQIFDFGILACQD